VLYLLSKSLQSRRSHRTWRNDQLL